MEVFGLNGTGYVRMAGLSASVVKDTLENGKVSEKNVYVWNAKDRTPAIYYIGSSMRSYVPVVVGADPQLLIQAECNGIKNATVSGSQINQAYGRFREVIGSHNSNFSQLNQEMAQARNNNDETALARAVGKMQALDGQRMALLDSLKKTEPFLGRIASLSTYTSFVSETDNVYGNEIEHYVNTFWRHVDFNDPAYEGLNAVYEASVGYTTTLMRAVTPDKITEILNKLVDKWPAGSKARFYTMGGAFNMLSQQNNAAALPMAERLVAEYQEKEPAAVGMVAKSFNKLKTSTPGVEAPNLVGDSPEGETIDLKDLRGKVVLVDFWASWCGPCRKENPNVKRLYDKYASKGFEILGVSLDRTKDRWQQAIDKDQLNWLHISDLKHWSSAHAALYGVRSIPDTVLLDGEGKIIARGLRGPQLEAKLAELFKGK